MKRGSLIVILVLTVLLTAGCQLVLSGNYTLRRGETLAGGLLMTSGNATIEAGARVAGPVVMTSGNLLVDGQVDGDITITSGSIALGPEALVRGDIIAASGDVRRAAGAQVLGRQSDLSRESGMPRWAGAMFGLAFLPVLIIALILFSIAGRGSLAPTPPAPSSSEPRAGAAPFHGETSPRTPGLIFGTLLIVLGVLFLVQQFLAIDIWDWMWPFLILFAGLFFFAMMFAGGRSSAGLAIPGSILTMVGLILVVQNVFDLFQTWAYAWALVFPVSLGVGQYIDGVWRADPGRKAHGLRQIQAGLILFVLLGAFFELVINLSGFSSDRLAQYAWPLILILFGLWLLARTLIRPRPGPEAGNGKPQA